MRGIGNMRCTEWNVSDSNVSSWCTQYYGLLLLQSSAGTLLGQFITLKLVTVISGRCSCQFTDAFITREQVYCDESVPTEFVYRATISSYNIYSTDQLLSFIREWILSNEIVVYDGNEMTFDPKCPLNLTSNNDQLCMSTTPGVGLSFGAAIGVALGCILGGILITVVAILLLLLMHKLHIWRHSRWHACVQAMYHLSFLTFHLAFHIHAGVPSGPLKDSQKFRTSKQQMTLL